MASSPALVVDIDFIDTVSTRDVRPLPMSRREMAAHSPRAFPYRRKDINCCQEHKQKCCQRSVVFVQPPMFCLRFISTLFQVVGSGVAVQQKLPVTWLSTIWFHCYCY